MNASTTMTAPAIEAEKDSSTVASEEGFTGTLAAFLDWLRDSLCYGFLRVTEIIPEGSRDGLPVMLVETVTGGYSSDERLLARVRTNFLMATFWASSHRGGLTTYQFPKSWYESAEEFEFLAPEDGVFERLRFVRTVQLYSENGDCIELDYKAGAALMYREPALDITEPDALLVIRPISSVAAL